jgi:hypothetical protein
MAQQTHKLPALLGIGPLEYLGSLGDLSSSFVLATL